MSEPAEEGKKYKWEIEPHPYDSQQYDVFVTDDDQQALQAISDAAEAAWDDIEPGQEKILKIRHND